MDLVLLTQYFDTLTDVSRASRSNTLFVPTGPAAVSHLAGQIKQSILEAELVETQPQPQAPLLGTVPNAPPS